MLPRQLKIQSSPGHRTPVPQPADLTNHHTIRSLTIQLRGVVQSVKRVKRHIHAYTFQHQTRDSQKWIFGNWLFLDSMHTCLLCAMHLSTSIRCTHENVITNTSASWSCKVHLSPTSKLPTIRLFGVVLSIVDYVCVCLNVQKQILLPSLKLTGFAPFQ